MKSDPQGFNLTRQVSQMAVQKNIPIFCQQGNVETGKNQEFFMEMVYKLIAETEEENLISVMVRMMNCMSYARII